MARVIDKQSKEDIELMACIVAQDEACLRLLVERYKSRLMGVAYNVLYSRELAEEVVMDVFVRVWEKGHTFKSDRGNVRGWMIQMTRNRSIDYLRKSGRRLDDQSVGWTDIHDNVISGGGPDPEKMMQQSFVASQVQGALKELSEDHQYVLGLAYYKGMSNSEIAEATGIPLGTVKTRIRRGMLKLKESLGTLVT
ncbi:MAG: RNA polymerase sigma-70 factor (ECF subfamily) [Cellvibrionaceae bacterium]|jgi:RNA polymerase sigma-70 factor (ECF subfamily)